MLSAASQASLISRGETGEVNGFVAPGSPSKLSDELARRLTVADSNPTQPQVRLLLLWRPSYRVSGVVDTVFLGGGRTA